MIQSIISLSLNELSIKLHAREISCVELCRFYLERIKKYGMQDNLNCVLAVNQGALDEARELDRLGPEGFPFYGLCVLLKDNIDVKGMATTAGSVALKDNIADFDAPFVRTLREKGAVILGKTNMTEFANFLTQGMPGGFSSLGGQVVNAYDKAHTPSGSSSGSAVAMSARLCSFAIGTDTSFSVVGCATENGVVGFKPAIGTISTEGVIPITAAFDEIGFFTRDIADMKFVAERLSITISSESSVRWNISTNPQKVRLEKTSLRKSLVVWNFNREIVSKEQMGRYEALFDRLKEDGWVISEQKGRSTSKLKEMMLRCFSSELREYFKLHEGNTKSEMTPEKVLEIYRENLEKLAPYGIEYLESSIAYERDPENTKAIMEIRADMARERKLLTEELSGFDCGVMTGPTTIMNYVGFSSLSVPFTVALENGLPRSVIIFGTDMQALLNVGEELERYGDVIQMPKL